MNLRDSALPSAPRAPRCRPLASRLALALGGAATLLAASLLSGGVARAEGKEPFTVTVQAAAGKVGATGTVQVQVKPSGGYHINQEYPTSLKLAATAGVDLPKDKLGKKDAEVKVAEEEIRIQVPYTAKEAGKKTIAGTLSFAVCSATNCDPRRVSVNLDIDAR